MYTDPHTNYYTAAHMHACMHAHTHTHSPALVSDSAAGLWCFGRIMRPWLEQNVSMATVLYNCSADTQHCLSVKMLTFLDSLTVLCILHYQFFMFSPTLKLIISQLLCQALKKTHNHSSPLRHPITAALKAKSKWQSRVIFILFISMWYL